MSDSATDPHENYREYVCSTDLIGRPFGSLEFCTPAMELASARTVACLADGKGCALLMPQGTLSERPQIDETSALMGTSAGLPQIAAQKRVPDAVDLHVGRRVRSRRISLTMTQKELADAIGLTFQQVKNFEVGVSRVFAGRLYDLARALDVPISYFFEGIAATKRETDGPSRAHRARAHRDAGLGSLPETRELMRAYSRIARPAVRRRILELIKSLQPFI